MSPASFGLKPCGCCFLFTFTHHFTYFFSLSPTLHSLFFLIHPFLHVAVGCLSQKLWFFLFLWVSLLKHHTHTHYPSYPTAQKPPVGRRTDESSFALDCTVFPRRVMLFFYSNLCPQSQWCLLCLEGDSDCFLLPFFNRWGVLMTGDKRRNPSQFIVIPEKIKDRGSGQM